MTVVVAVYNPGGCATEPPTPTLNRIVVVAPLGWFEPGADAIVVSVVDNPSQHDRLVCSTPVLQAEPLSLKR